MDKIIVNLHLYFAIKDLAILCYFLATDSLTGMHLSQHKFMKEIFHMVSLLDAKPVATPMSFEKLHNKVDGYALVDTSKYQRLVGSL